jgi:hypothetical protein
MFMLLHFPVLVFHKTNMMFVEQKSRLAKSVSSELRSCGWVDDIGNFMRAAKRQCIQDTDMPQDIDAMRLGTFL